MSCYSVQPRDQMFVKGYGFMSFAKNMGKNIWKNKSKSLKGKYSQKLLDPSKQPATDAFKTASKRAIQKIAEGKLLIKLQRPQEFYQNNSETVESKIENTELDREKPSKRYICPEKRQKIIYDLRVIV